MICMYKAVEYLYPAKIRAQYSYQLPNVLNFSFDLLYFIVLAMLTYIPGMFSQRLYLLNLDDIMLTISYFTVKVFPQLYLHMFAQRKKLLGGGSVQKKKTE